MNSTEITGRPYIRLMKTELAGQSSSLCAFARPWLRPAFINFGSLPVRLGVTLRPAFAKWVTCPDIDDTKLDLVGLPFSPPQHP